MHYLNKDFSPCLSLFEHCCLSQANLLIGESMSFSVTLTKERCPSIHRHVQHQTLPQVLPVQSLLWSQHLSHPVQMRTRKLGVAQ